MCGIVGQISLGAPVDPTLFDAATDALAPRGPDGRGVWIDDARRIALGHRRLAILDLSAAGAQPMHHGTLRLSYNGEIYNHLDLRRTLEAKGHRFSSTCDSETLLHAFAEWGPACVPRLRGIFAFAIWDEDRKRLFVARDHLGVKPLYYRQDAAGFAFASQPRALSVLADRPQSISPEAFMDYLAYGIVPGAHGITEGLSKLPPAHQLIWQAGEIVIEPYWSLPETPEIFDETEAVNALRDLLPEVVEAQMQSDVPVETFLSGGIDSSLVTAIAAQASETPVKAFTMGFAEARSDERAFAARAAAHCGAKPVVGILTRDRFDEIVDAMVEAYDEPFGIGAGLPMVAISKLASAQGTRVVLTGDGADEMFAGYRHYDDLAAHYRKHGRATADNAPRGPRAFWTKLRHGRFDPLDAYKSHNAEIFGSTAEAIVPPDLAAKSRGRWREGAHFRRDLPPVEAAQRCDIATYLSDEILVKVDRATMAYGIEARVPFLDPKLVELAFRIAPALHIAGGERKALLKKAAATWLPDEILSARKKGFSVPIGLWMKETDLRARLLDAVQTGRLVDMGFLEPAQIAPVLDRLTRPAASLLQLYLLERWAQRWL